MPLTWGIGISNRVNLNGNWTIENTTTVLDALATCEVAPATVKAIILNDDLAGSIDIHTAFTYTLDGVPGRDRLDMPPGFLITSGSIFFGTGLINTAGYTLMPIHDGVNLTPLISMSAAFCGGSRSIPVSTLGFATNFSLMFGNITYDFTQTGPPPVFVGLNHSTGVSGAYILWSNALTFTHDGVGPGATVHITDGNHQLDQVQSVQAYYVFTNPDGDSELSDPVAVENYTLTPTTLTFKVPPTLPYGTPIIIVTTVDGMIFTGDVPMGTLMPTLANASGLYEITTNKRNDTMYDRTVSPVTTRDVAIPNPFIRTGYIGG